MFHAPNSENKQPGDPTRTRPAPEQAREAHPYPAAVPARTAKRAATLQRSIGNQAVLRLLEQRGRNPPAGQGATDRSNSPQAQTHFTAPPGVLQAKLVVGPANDPLEHEADRVAEQVMRMPDPGPAVTAAPPQIGRKCAACEEKEKPLQAKPSRPPGFDFSNARIAPPSPVLSDDLGANPHSDRQVLDQAVVPSVQIAVDDVEESEDIYDGGATAQEVADADPPLPTEGAGAPLCFNGGGSSICKLTSGNFEIESIDNTCCTRDCTLQHEQQHVKDHTAWGCCKSASTAWNKSANPGKVAAMYRKWAAQADLITECNAYRNDVRCATALQKSKACDGKGKDTRCCLSILSYKNKYADLAKEYCAKAPAKLPPCPNFDLATLLP